MKKILFPTDFSDVSKNAFIYALKLADAVDAEIITLHVYALDSPAFLDVSIYLQEIYEYEELSEFENYKDEIPILRNIAQANDLGHIPIRNVLIQGNLVTEMLKISDDENIDFIVLGTKGATHLRQIFLGTTLTKIMDESKVTVLGVPENCQFAPINKILFTTKYHFNDIEALQKTKNLAKILNSHIDCLNIKPPHKVHNDDYVTDFKNIFKDSGVDFNSVLSDDVEGSILNFIQQNNINMLAIHIIHKGFFEKLFQVSLSKKLAVNINIPILSVK
ncbi:universal stress protein [Flavobacterium aquicola]|uniref:Nucleotide-binding universal stress UspA family protein n=1 Tax=Flavobacterium aquicola TaxID=1682742 RepID=A0A3E0ECW4_9FLAO|nr:universal stress protein [Flavobacterium aquicola]REG96085.1 nucleotide-binding universal stress UspA family protein [Flavobacterium aquicola]